MAIRLDIDMKISIKEVYKDKVKPTDVAEIDCSVASVELSDLIENASKRIINDEDSLIGIFIKRED